MLLLPSDCLYHRQIASIIIRLLLSLSDCFYHCRIASIIVMASNYTLYILDGTYTRLLRRTKNLSWRSHPTRKLIYGDLHPVSSLVKARRVQFAGHCHRAENEVISSLILWRPSPLGQRSQRLTFPDVISRDTGIMKEDLMTAMQDRDCWREIVNSMISTAVER